MPISYLPHISCTPLKICTSQQDSPVSRTVFTLFFLFFGRPSLSISDQDWGRDFMVELDSIAGQLLVTLVHISRSVQRSKTVQFPKQFSPSSLCFLVVQVLASQIKTVEETLWVKLTPIWVNHLAPISCTQFKIRTAQHDSPVPKQFSHSSLCFFWWTMS